MDYTLRKRLGAERYWLRKATKELRRKIALASDPNVWGRYRNAPLHDSVVYFDARALGRAALRFQERRAQYNTP